MRAQRLTALLLGTVLAACPAKEPPTLDVERTEGGITLSADRPMTTLSVWSDSGEPISKRTLPSPSMRASIPIAPLQGARWRVRAVFADGLASERTIDGPLLPFDAMIEAPAGQGRRPITQGARYTVWAVPGARAAVVLTARLPSMLTVDDGERETQLSLSVPGDRALVSVPLDHSREVTVSLGEQRLSFSLDPKPLDLQSARKQLAPTGVWLPASPEGEPDVTLPPDQIIAPIGLLSRLGLRSRPAPDQAPWTYLAVGLRNTDSFPIDLVVRLAIEDEHGQPAAAFRSRNRGQEGQTFVAALLRVPPGEDATAALPIWLDPELLPASSTRFVRKIEITPLGAAAPLHQIAGPLLVVRGTGARGTAFLIALGCSLIGWGMLLFGAKRFLSRTSTADLVTIAMFTATAFTVGAVLQLFGMVLATLLGPLAPFVTGIPDDAFRAVLLTILLTSIPSPGVFATTTALGALMRGLMLGSFHPVDLLYVGMVIATHEAALWTSGITRRPCWREERSIARWLRLCAGLALPNALCAGLGLASTAILYRLWYADWYILALVALPGFCYVVLGVWLALPIASGLRQISR